MPRRLHSLVIAVAVSTAGALPAVLLRADEATRGPAPQPELQPEAQPATQPAAVPSTAPTTAPSTRPAVDLTARVAALIPKLASGNWKDRDAAEAALVALGPDAAPAVNDALGGDVKPEVRSRLQGVLTEYDRLREYGPTLVTLSLKDADAKAVFDALFKAAKAEYSVYPENALQNAGKLSVDYDRTPFWEAMTDVCKKTGMNVRHMYDGHKLTVAAERGNGPMFSPQVVAGPVLVTAEGMNVSANINFANAASASRAGGLSLMVLLEPRFRATGGVIQVDRLVDDRGESLLLEGEAARRATGSPGTLSQQADSVWSGNVPVRMPKEGTRLAKFEGQIVLTTHAHVEKVEIGDVLKAAEVTKVVGEKRFTVHAVAREGDGFTIKMTLFRGNMDPGEWQWFNYPYGRIRLVDAKGKDLSPSSGSGGNDGQKAEFQMTFNRNNVGGGGEVGEPAKFVWELPVDSHRMIAPFSFKDLPLP